MPKVKGRQQAPPNKRRRAAVVHQLRSLADQIERGEIESFDAEHTADLLEREPANGSRQYEVSGQFCFFLTYHRPKKLPAVKDMPQS